MNPRQIVIRSKEFDHEFQQELKFLKGEVLHATPYTYWLRDDQVELAWADCVWREVKSIEVESIADASRKLRAISTRWRYYGDLLNRRGALMGEKLTVKKSSEPFVFPTLFSARELEVPTYTMGGQNLIFYSHDISRPTLDGKINFKENKLIPPSRAYLKLWEALTLLNDWPKKGEQVLDLGSSPGSWTWALAELKANVLSIDRSTLDPRVMKNKNITFKTGDAFSVEPVKMDWVFSDVICYPEKLYEYVSRWVDSGLCKKFVCNVKFAGEVSPKIVDQFRKIPHSRVIHLLNGKKEVTWIRHPDINTV